VKRVGLTGGMATGKTTVAQFFVACGAALIDADAIVHDLYAHDHTLIAAIRSAFGCNVIAGDGTLDRRALGAVIFPDPSARKTLEDIVHPAVRAAIEAEATRLSGSDTKVVIYDIPLLFESGRDWHFDMIIVVTCEEARQIARLCSRSGCDEATARQRIAMQLPQAEKISRADLCISTDGSLTQTHALVMAAWQRLVAPAHTT
jgi:dephospho-CoA kinase